MSFTLNQFSSFVRISYVVQAYHDLLLLAGMLKEHPRLMVLTNHVLRQAYATGQLMLPKTFIYLYFGAKPPSASGSISVDKSNLWKVDGERHNRIPPSSPLTMDPNPEFSLL